jgi:hypothetical protein
VVVLAPRGGLIDEAVLVRRSGRHDRARPRRSNASYVAERPRASNVLLTAHASSFTELGATRTAEAVVASFRELLAGCRVDA